VMDQLGHQDGDVIQHSMISKSIERAQKKVEENNFGIRKRLLEYDDVMNYQREAIYSRRRNAISGEKVEIDLQNMMVDSSSLFVDKSEGLACEDFREALMARYSIDLEIEPAEYDKIKKNELISRICQVMQETYKRRMENLDQKLYPIIKEVYEKQGSIYQNIAIPVSDGKLVYTVLVDLKKAYETKGRELIRAVEKTVTLRVIDEYWKNHLREMDDLKQSVQNAAYEQKDPIVVYKSESYNLFITMLENLSKDVLAFLLRAQIYLRQEQQPEDVVTEGHEKRSDMSRMQTSRPDLLTNSSEPKTNAPIHVEKKVGRNDPCPCGSGKKYKNCHGKEA
ncbi:MAG: SEC-C domain-containing protein, partial [Bacteroidales bacterium]|nr:SEC-C domain-containing protein [Bacteroidales bacterium]